jgi:hypothetical protein
MPLGIQDTQPHDMVLLIDLNNIQRAETIINNANNDINEDATFYENNGQNIIVPVIQNGR